MATKKEIRNRIYSFLHQSFGISRAENEEKLQELKRLLKEYEIAVLTETTATTHKNPQILEKKEESKFFSPKTFG